MHRLRILLATVLASALACPFVPVAAPVADSVRQTLSFNPGWKFIKADPPGAARPEFDDTAWQSVSAPHTFNDMDTFDNWSLSNHRGELEQWSGRTWYRKPFEVPAAWQGRRVVVEFEAVRQVAEIYLNGELVGKSQNGFIPFGIDLTPYLKFGQANMLAVMCDNTFPLDIEFNSVAKTVMIWNSPHWHPAHGGIYRDVWLHLLNPVHVTLPLFSNLGTSGAYVYATNISADSADIGFEAEVKNESATACRIALKAELLDRDGAVVVKCDGIPQPLTAGGTMELKLSGKLAKPHRWEPAYPYLYAARLTLEKDGVPVDATTVPLGVRSVKWDVKTGFSINGRHVKLHGWGQKPTDEWPGLGAAFPDWMHDYSLRLMRDAGGNWVRWGHCAGGPAQIAASDRYGVMVEQPGVDGEGDALGDIWKIRAAAFRDTLIYFRNNPSIVIWEGGNQSVTVEHARELRGYMDKYDPHGGRAYAHRRANKITGQFMDVTIGTEGSHEQPHLPVIEGEYDREEAPRRVPDRFTPPWENYHAIGTYDLTDEQFAVNQVSHYVRKLGAPSHCGGANWIFSDSTSGGRVQSEVARASGEVDGVRLPKEAYYACAAMWRAEPAVHIIGHWNYPAGTVKPVYVVSNCPKVELRLNGKSLGFGTVSDRHLFTFNNVAWQPGELTAIAYRNDQPVAQQVKRTAGEAVALRLTPMTAPGGLRATGSDVVLVDVEAVDKNGERCPTFQQRADFVTAGPGVWRGGYNSGKINSINNTFLDLECGINRIAIRSTLIPGTITLSATCQGLKPAALTIESLSAAISNGALATPPPVPPQEPLQLPPAVTPETTGIATPTTVAAKPEGAFIREFSYSGPTGGATVQRGAAKGGKVYADRNYTFTQLPDFLTGADYVQFPQADNQYSAVDLVVFTAKTDGVLYVAHDKRLPRPAWLTESFTDTGATFPLPKATMSVFKRALLKDETLTLGSNVEAQAKRACTMYILFIQPTAAHGPK